MNNAAIKIFMKESEKWKIMHFVVDRNADGFVMWRNSTPFNLQEQGNAHTYFKN